MDGDRDGKWENVETAKRPNRTLVASHQWHRLHFDFLTFRLFDFCSFGLVMPSTTELQRQIAALSERLDAVENLTDTLPTRFALQSGAGGSGGNGFGYSGFLICGGSSDGSGRLDENRLRSTLVLDVVAEVWRVAIDMPPKERDRHAVAAIGSEAYACGGHGYGSAVYKYVDRYTGPTNSWTILPDMPLAVSTPAAAGVDGKLHVCGGQDNDILSEQHIALDPDTESWSSKAKLMNPELNKHAATAVEATLHVVGGADPRATAAYRVYSDSWTAEGDLPALTTAGSLAYGRKQLGAATVEGKVYAVGGYRSGGLRSYSNLEFTPGASAWVRKNEVPQFRFNHATGVVDGKILIAAGQNGDDGAKTAETNKFDPLANTWTKMPDLSMGGRFALAGAGI